MIQNTWTPEARELWGKLESFPLDDDAALFGFTARLAKENGWSRDFARRVGREYKRFLMLAS